MDRFAALRVGYWQPPDPVIGLYTGHRVDPLTRAVTQLLGGRHPIHGDSHRRYPSTHVLALGVKVDFAHTASMLGLAVLHQRRRRAGLIDAAVAGSFAMACAVLATRAQPSCPHPAWLSGWTTSGKPRHPNAQHTLPLRREP